jgi:hypothetical protein
MNLTPDQYKQAMASAVKVVEANVGKIMLNGANLGSALMQRRVFNKGIATSGKKMMYRSAPYKRLRVDAKLQVAHKDLIFTGNLFNSLTILGKSNKEVSYGFNNSETATIANYQETSSKQVNQPIFDLSTKEIAQVERAMAKDVLRIVVATIESYPNMPSVSPLQEDAIKKSVARNQAKKKKQSQKKKAETARKKVATTTKTKLTIDQQISKKKIALSKVKDPSSKTAVKLRESLANLKLRKEKARVNKRVARAKAMRQGVYKPKKRK